MLYTHKKNKPQPKRTMWMNLRNMLSERRNKPKSTWCMILFE